MQNVYENSPCPSFPLMIDETVEKRPLQRSPDMRRWLSERWLRAEVAQRKVAGERTLAQGGPARGGPCGCTQRARRARCRATWLWWPWLVRPRPLRPPRLSFLDPALRGVPLARVRTPPPAVRGCAGQTAPGPNLRQPPPPPATAASHRTCSSLCSSTVQSFCNLLLYFGQRGCTPGTATSTCNIRAN